MSPAEAVENYMQSEDVRVNGWTAVEMVQVVIRALDYSSCVLCPDCGAEVDTRSAEKL
jgi:hypothetical protein